MLEKTNLFVEIHEQPEVIANFLGKGKDMIQPLVNAIRDRGITHVVIAARGTSDNAARYAQYVLGAHNQLVVALATPSLFSIYEKPPRFGKALVLGISQSGQSPDIVAVLTEAKRQGVLTAAITNSPQSDLAKEADFVIDLKAGVEKAVAATKTYTVELASIALLSALLGDDQDRLHELSQVPVAMAKTLQMNNMIASMSSRYRYMEHSVAIGRGYNYSTAFELALKIKELTYTVVIPYSSADFLHGPLAMIEPGFPVIVVAPTGLMQEKMQNFVQTLWERDAEVIAISDDPVVLEKARIPLALPQSVPEWLSPLTTIMPGQMFALHLANARDFNVDSPRGLRKVTETQ